MRLAGWLALALCLVTLGCQESTTQPRVATIEGVVRYPDGSVVYRAKVVLDGGGTTFTDRSGSYQFTNQDVGATVTLFASDGYTPGVVYGVNHFGRVQVRVDKPKVTQDIVLDQSMPI